MQSAVEAAGGVKNFMLLVIVGLVALSFFAPVVFAQLKAWALNLVQSAVLNLFPVLGNLTSEAVSGVGSLVSKVSTGTPPTPASGDQSIMQRLNELETACPGAEPALLWKWAKQGYDAPRAMAAYISYLTSKSVPQQTQTTSQP